MRTDGKNLALGVVLAAALGWASPALAQHEGHGQASPAPKASPASPATGAHAHHGEKPAAPAAGSPSHHMHGHMMEGAKHAPKMKMTGDPDVDFAMMMAMHHKHGIAMAQVEARDGKDAKVREMARKIVETQQKELDEFRAYLKSKGHEAP